MYSTNEPLRVVCYTCSVDKVILYDETFSFFLIQNRSLPYELAPTSQALFEAWVNCLVGVANFVSYTTSFRLHIDTPSFIRMAQ